MKRFFTVLSLLIFMLFFAVACIEKSPKVIKESDTYIVISTFDTDFTIKSDTTLIDYMQHLKNQGNIEFEIQSGMIKSINGITNPINYSSCWMLYTSDAENSNDAWGTVEYKGEIYGSAVLGAETLKIKQNCLYIWVYQTF